METAKEPSPLPCVQAGSALIAGDGELTLLEADAVFLSLLHAGACELPRRNQALRPRLTPNMEARLDRALKEAASGDVSLFAPDAEEPLVFAFRVPSAGHDATPVFHVLLVRMPSPGDEREEDRDMARRCAKSAAESAGEVLDHLGPTAVFVIDSSSHEILYFNRAMARLLPELKLGDSCHTALCGRDSVCRNCPVERGEECQSSISAEQMGFHFARQLGRKGALRPGPDELDVTVSRILWENRLPAHIVQLSPHLLSEEELRERDKREICSLALNASYEYICDINLETGRYAIFSANGKPLPAGLPREGDYGQSLTRLPPLIAPDARQAFIQVFSMDALRRGMDTKTLTRSFDFSRREGEEFRWKRRLLFPYTAHDGGRHILLCSRDIHEHKLAELREREDNSSIELALRASYAKLYHINMEKRSIACVFLNTDVLAPIDVTGNFDTDIETICENRVHPDDRAPLRAFLNLSVLREALARGQEPSLEYRKKERDGEYHWVSSTMMPIPGRKDDVLIAVREVSHLIKARERFFRLLESSYAEIYEVDLENDAIHTLQQSSMKVTLEALDLGFADCVRWMAEHVVHPDDSARFTAFYAPKTLKRAMDAGDRPSTEYRKREPDGSWKWLTSRVLPMPDESRERILILCMDITDQKTAEARIHNLEQRSTAIFSRFFDQFIEVDLVTWKYLSQEEIPTLNRRRSGRYSELLAMFMPALHPDDRDEVLRHITPDALLEASRAGTSITLQYRIRAGFKYKWRENRLIFLTEDGHEKAFSVTRDITHQKNLEVERSADELRFHVALQKSYTEVYEVDLAANKPRLIYANDTSLIPVDSDPAADIHEVARTLIHPDDRESFVASFIGTQVLETFTTGQLEVSAEFRRLEKNGNWCWVSGRIVPLVASSQKKSDRAMFLVKDISERKAQEQLNNIAAQYDRALRGIYDELLELNISRENYRFIYRTGSKAPELPQEGELSFLLQNFIRNRVHPDDRAKLAPYLNPSDMHTMFSGSRELRIEEIRTLWADGRYHWISLTLFPVARSSGADEIYLMFVMDIGEKKHAEETARQNELLQRRRFEDERYRAIVNQTGTLVFEKLPDEEGNHYVSPRLTEQFEGNYEKGRGLFAIWLEDEVVHPEDREKLEQFTLQAPVRDYSELTLRLKTRQNGYIWCKVALSRLYDTEGRLLRYLGTLNDVDQATRSLNSLRYRAEYDPLSGVLNMRTFYEKAKQMLNSRPAGTCSIIRMDIERFKVINDLYGLHEGDRLLSSIADMLRLELRGQGELGRLGGDIFCMCVDYSRTRIVEFITRLEASLAQYPLPLKIVPAFGICEVDSPETPVSILCDWANLALTSVKGNYLVHHAFYDGQMRDRLLLEKRIEARMRLALQQGQFHMYLQPKVRMDNSLIVASEALVRWIDPEEGIIPPMNFIPLFERNGFIISLDECIWEQACVCLRRWLDEGHTPPPISINVSRIHAYDSALGDKLISLVERYGIPPRLLEIELTESAFIDNESRLLDTMKRLRERGFLFAVDDFGTGYSSLNMLKDLPVDILKLDRAFLNDVFSTGRGKALVRSIITLAKDLGLKTVAEGVETEEHAVLLLQAGCAIAQGYYYSRPVPVAEFEALAFGPQPPFPVAPSLAEIAENMDPE